MNKENSKEPKLKKLIGFKPWEIRLFWTLVILIIIAPFVLTRDIGFISFEDTGQIGDTIGGITAPFVNLLAAFLVYKSFSAQIEANANQRKDHNKQIKEIRKEYQFNYIRDLYSLISNDYYANSKDINNESWVSSLITLTDSFNDPNMWNNQNHIGLFVSRKTSDQIIESINDLSLSKLDIINRQVRDQSQKLCVNWK